MARYVKVDGALVPIGPGPFEPVESELDALYVRRDGTVAFTGNFNAGGFLLQNLANPVADTDAATKVYVDNEIATHTH